MYRSDLDAKHRSGAVAAVVAIHAALLFVLLHMAGRIDLADPQSVMRVFDINSVKPPPPPPPPPPRQQPRPKDKEGGAAPPNIRSEATPVVAPRPRVVIPPKPQIATSETPRQGTAPTQGAAPVPGPGTGAGGVGTGTGTGSGSGGSGPGGGGEGGAAYPPRLLTPTLRSRDFDPTLLQSWPRGGDVFVGLRVLPNGTVSECKIFRSSGVGEIDSEVCNLAHLRFRFRPALDRYGQPVASWFGYRQVAL
jgi:protein TonB